jgi:hypothetical protein
VLEPFDPQDLVRRAVELFLPLAEEKDLRIDTFCSSGPGGQSVNTTDSGEDIHYVTVTVGSAELDDPKPHPETSISYLWMTGFARSRSHICLAVSSAPARKDTKMAIMEYFNISKMQNFGRRMEAGHVTYSRLNKDPELMSIGVPLKSRKCRVLIRIR